MHGDRAVEMVRTQLQALGAAPPRDAYIALVSSRRRGRSTRRVELTFNSELQQQDYMSRYARCLSGAGVRLQEVGGGHE